MGVDPESSEKSRCMCGFRIVIYCRLSFRHTRGLACSYATRHFSFWPIYNRRCDVRKVRTEDVEMWNSRVATLGTSSVNSGTVISKPRQLSEILDISSYQIKDRQKTLQADQ